jgi:hypothetical protein
MAIQVDGARLEASLRKFTFQAHGDRFERQFGHYVVRRFPNCEGFWQVFVVPLTQRITSPRDNPDWIRFREGPDNRLEDMAMAHYSMFFHLAYAHLHCDAPRESSFEDIYVHLVSACDLASRILGNWYLILLECRGARSAVFEDLSREDFLQRAGAWYDDYYEDTRKYYLSKGRTRAIRLVTEKDLLREYLGENQHWPDYRHQTDLIRTYRNVIVHDIRLGRIIPRDAEADDYLVPKPEQIQKGRYRSWREVAEVADDQTIVSQHFGERYKLARASLSDLECVLNGVWDKLIEDLVEEFYSSERAALREKFDIELTDTASPIRAFVTAALDYPPGPSEAFEAGFATASPAMFSGRASDIAPTGGSAVWGDTGPGSADSSSSRQVFEPLSPEPEDEEE